MAKFYSLKEINKIDAQYNIILGMRSNGKSYAVKEQLVNESLKKGAVCGVLIRRLDADIKSSIIANYFDDIPVEKLSKKKYDCFTFYRDYFYFGNRNEDGTITKGEKFCRVLALSNDERYKSSTVLPDVTTIIYEEFTTNKLYLNNETERFLNLVSTICRNKSVKVYMIANKISRVCPYFSDWGLKGIPSMDTEKGQIDTYELRTLDGDIVKIAVEMCAPSENKKSGMFFGLSAKNIDGTDWQVKERPKLKGTVKDYEVIKELSLQHMDFTFNIMLLCHKKEEFMCVYVYPAHVKVHDRLLTDQYSTNPQHTPTLHAKNKAECLISRLINDNKLVFPNNLIGEDFNTTIANMDKYPFALA